MESRRSEEGLVIKSFKSSVSLLKSKSLSSTLNSIAFQVKTDDPKSCNGNMTERGIQSVFYV